MALLASQFDPGKAGAARQLTVYTPESSYSLPTRERQGQIYIGLLDLVEPLGATSVSVNGKQWKLLLHDNDALFTEGSTQAEVHGNTVDLGGKFLVEDNRPLVPLKSSFPLLSSFFERLVEFHPVGRRIFIGGASTRFLADLNRNKSSLTLTFTQRVNPSIFQERDKIRIVFQREPVVAKAPSQTFADKDIHSLSFTEDNGTATITLAVGAVMNASLAGDGKTILIQPANPPGVGAAGATASNIPAAPGPTQAGTPTASTPATGLASPSLPPPAQASATPLNAGQPGAASSPSSPSSGLSPGMENTGTEFLVVIDASHGGEDEGATLETHLNEKDLTLTLARRLKVELQNRGITARLVRDGDVSLSFDQRAEIGNGQHASLYLAIHAGSPGGGIRVYAPALISMKAPDASTTAPFLPWEAAQRPFLGRSQAMAGAVAEELGKKDFQAVRLSAPLRPLNNIMAPAIAVEVSPDPENLQNLANVKLQAAIVAGLAAGILQGRARIEARP